MDFAIDLLLTLHIAVSLLLVLVVLMQRPRSEGLGTAFASGMVEQYIGPATGVLVKFTTYMGGAFFALTILLAILYAHRTTERSKIGERLRSVPAVKAVVKPPVNLPPPPALAIKAPAPAPAVSASPALAAPAASATPAAVASPAPTAVSTPNDIPAPAAQAAPSASAAPSAPPAASASPAAQ